MNKSEFIIDFKKYFDDQKVHKIVFKMGESSTNIERIEEVVRKFKEISNFIFGNKSFWMILVMWDVNRGTKLDLKKCGFDDKLSSKVIHGDIKDDIFGSSLAKEDEIIYFFYENFSIELIYPIVYCIGGYEIGIEPTANVSAYFLSFEDKPVFINLYDDRGMEFLCTEIELINEISKKFKEYLLK